MTTEDIDLPEIGRDGMGEVLGVDAFGRHHAEAGGDGGGRDAAEKDRGVVGRPAELVARGIGALSPGIVGELVREFERRTIGLEPVGALAELPAHAPDGAIEPAITHAAV